MTDYYYLISSLPTIGLHSRHDKLDFDALYQTILENLSDADNKLFVYLVYPNDNKNLIRAISHKYEKQVVFHRFHRPSVISEDAMNDFLRPSNKMPAYMREFIEKYSEEFDTAPLPELEKALLESFYKEVFGTGDDFLVKYFTFEINLKNISVALNSRLYDYHPQDEIIGQNPINPQLIKSTASDLNIGNEFPFVEALSEMKKTKNPYKISMGFDDILWNYIDEIVGFSFFNTHKLLGYVAQLLMIKRWMDLDKEEGKNRLTELTNSMMGNFKLPQLHK